MTTPDPSGHIETNSGVSSEQGEHGMGGLEPAKHVLVLPVKI